MKGALSYYLANFYGKLHEKKIWKQMGTVRLLRSEVQESAIALVIVDSKPPLK